MNDYYLFLELCNRLNIPYDIYDHSPRGFLKIMVVLTDRIDELEKKLNEKINENNS